MSNQPSFADLIQTTSGRQIIITGTEISKDEFSQIRDTRRFEWNGKIEGPKAPCLIHTSTGTIFAGTPWLEIKNGEACTGYHTASFYVGAVFDFIEKKLKLPRGNRVVTDWIIQVSQPRM